jgi:hypothetical protein
MTPQEEIRKLEETKQRVILFSNELDDKLARNEINQMQYQALLKEKLQGKSKEEVLSYINSLISAEKNKFEQKMSDLENENELKKKKIIAFSTAAILLVAMTMIGIFYFNPNALTGQVTGVIQTPEILSYNQVFDHYTETRLEINNLTSLKISGVLEGTGAKVKLRIDGIDYVVADITNPANEPNLITGLAIGEPAAQPAEEPAPGYVIGTDKREYSAGETVTITLTPDATDKSFYVSFGTQTERLESNTYLAQAAGEYQAVALVVLPNDILRLETNFTVAEQAANTTNETNQTTEPIPPETPPTNPPAPTASHEFNELCIDTCSITETSQPLLIIEPAENSKLTITTITIIRNRENLAPEQTGQIPDLTLNAGQSITIDLNNYFTEPENEAIIYDINEIPEINATISQSTLTITSQQPGIYTGFIYATDGNKLTASNTFLINVLEQGQATINQTNETTNQTTNETGNGTGNEAGGEIINQSTELVTNLTNLTNTTGLVDCSNPNPNERPLECIESINSTYFKPVNMFIENKDMKQVAKLTPIGNMFIRGDVIEYSTGGPDSQDYQLGYVNDNGDYTSTLWINSQTGDLHLKGKLTEVNGNLPVMPGYYAIANSRGIVLALINQQTGDLVVRGNVISLRGELK